MSNIIYFYISSYFIGFLLCIPIGPVNLEIFHTSLKKHYPQAVSIAIGAAIADGVWALTAFFGISPFRDTSYSLEWIFFLITALITGFLGIFTLKDAKFIEKKGAELTTKIRKRKRWAFVKGLLLVLMNPLGIISWMISLKFLESFKITIPLKLNYEIFFFLIVTLGAATYFLFIVFITNKMQSSFNPKRTAKVTKFLGYILIIFSLYFFYYALSAYLFGIDLP